jgi:hypothetical protein
MTRLTDAQLLLLLVAAGAGLGWNLGQSLVYDLTPAAYRLARRYWRRWTA